MDSFARITAIIIVVMMCVPFVVARINSIRTDTAGAQIETGINLIYEKIRKSQEITASDILKLQQTAKLANGSLRVVAGCLLEYEEAGTDKIKSRRDYLYLHDIEKLIAEEGRFLLLKGDSLSISISYGVPARNGYLLSLLKSQSRLSVGGIV